jgi:hypothetical protein
MKSVMKVDLYTIPVGQARYLTLDRRDDCPAFRELAMLTAGNALRVTAGGRALGLIFPLVSQFANGNLHRHPQIIGGIAHPGTG